ncbi:Bidirectional sugar transporter SWEET [Forsythia ovata]|uniref:Bidirectional sugar transporter SWEET n=1 Tax=Forsythia ovata TaxID=205694 RepID=A0ABD1TR01_9LAMI
MVNFIISIKSQPTLANSHLNLAYCPGGHQTAVASPNISSFSNPQLHMNALPHRSLYGRILPQVTRGLLVDSRLQNQWKNQPSLYPADHHVLANNILQQQQLPPSKWLNGSTAAVPATQSPASVSAVLWPSLAQSEKRVLIFGLKLPVLPMPLDFEVKTSLTYPIDRVPYEIGIVGPSSHFPPTFYQIYKKKSSEGFQSIPYVVALFSAMLWMYYAFLKSDNTTLLITINSVGCFIETIYICFYLFYAPNKVQTVKIILLLIVGGFGLIVLSTQLVVKASERAHVVGWMCLVFSLCVFIAPLGIVKQVIRTKSIEYMPFLLSFFLTISAVMWFFYGLLLKDYNIAIPNVLGFSFGILQMVLYVIYKNADRTAMNDKQKLPELPKKIIILEEHKIPELSEQIIDIVKISALLNAEKIPVVSQPINDGIEEARQSKEIEVKM